jgi:hypothetical protein
LPNTFHHLFDIQGVIPPRVITYVKKTAAHFCLQNYFL